MSDIDSVLARKQLIVALDELLHNPKLNEAGVGQDIAGDVDAKPNVTDEARGRFMQTFDGLLSGAFGEVTNTQDGQVSEAVQKMLTENPGLVEYLQALHKNEVLQRTVDSMKQIMEISPEHAEKAAAALAQTKTALEQRSGTKAKTSLSERPATETKGDPTTTATADPGAQATTAPKLKG